MTPSFEKLQNELKQLPGLGRRSAERIALDLLVVKPDRLDNLVKSLQTAAEKVKQCEICGNLTEDDKCSICNDATRDKFTLCVVEEITDMFAIDRSEVYKGLYHILHGKLSPINGVGPDALNFNSLKSRIVSEDINEIILSLSNDIEGEATCHFIQENIIEDKSINVTRIGFGLPSGGDIVYADAVTLRSALESRKSYK